jgi:hypothetical protein
VSFVIEASVALLSRSVAAVATTNGPSHNVQHDLRLTVHYFSQGDRTASMVPGGLDVSHSPSACCSPRDPSKAAEK